MLVYRRLKDESIEYADFGNSPYNKNFWLDAKPIIDANAGEMPKFINEDYSANSNKINGFNQQLQKIEMLKTLDVTTVTSGVSFHTDDKSIIDLMIARDEANEQGAVDTDVTDWKTINGIMEVTIFDIKEAIKLRLSNKAKLIGVEA